MRLDMREVVHELNNALAPLLMGSSLLKTEAATDRAAGLHGVMEAACQRSAALVNHLMTLNLPVTGERMAMDPGPVARRVRDLVAASTPRTTHFEVQVPPGLWPVTAVPMLFEQFLLLACLHARHLVRKGGRLVVQAANVPVTEDHRSPAFDAALVRWVRFRFALRPDALAGGAAYVAPASTDGLPWYLRLEPLLTELGGWLTVVPDEPPSSTVDLCFPAARCSRAG